MNDDARALAEAGYAWEIADAPLLHDDLNRADLAHAIELTELGVIPQPAARNLVRALLDLSRLPSDAVGYDPALGEMYTSREHHLAALIGADAGWLWAGRTRREAVRTAFRMVVRRQLLDLVDACSTLVDAICDTSAQHLNTVMPDYTYLQPAQPTTFGHYLLSFADPVLRESRRLLAELPHVNSSPAGSGAANGSALIKDRPRAAAALGFAGPVEHIRDAMWQTDPFVHVLFCATSLALTEDRLAEDLEIFTSMEFDFVRLGDDMVRESVLMPQKRNPYALTVIRGTTGILIGRMTGQMALGKAPSARSDTFIYAYGEVPRALHLSITMTRLAAAVVRTLEVDAARMRAALVGSNTEAADLATLVMDLAVIDYQSAHAVVAEAACSARAAGHEVAAADISEALARAGSDRALSDEELAAVTDPVRLVDSRDSLGGASPRVVAPMLARCRSGARDLRREAASQRELIERSESQVFDRARLIVGG